MNFKILTLFPEFIEQGIHTSILGKACQKGLLSFDIINIRDYSDDKNKRVDDYTYGGGAGMLMKAQPIYDAFTSNCVNEDGSKIRTIYLSPQGKTFTQSDAKELSKENNIVFLCGHYEGIDERVLEEIGAEKYSIGDYVLTGGELPALVMIDSIARLVPGVLGNEVSADIESFHGNLLEYPQFTRPEVWKDRKVPEVLLKGNPKEVNKWRLSKQIELTKNTRPDLYSKYIESEKLLENLNKDKRNNIHIIEALRRGIGDIISVSPLLVYLPGAGIVYVDSFKGQITKDEFQKLIPQKARTLIVKEGLLESDFLDVNFKNVGNFRNVLYTEKVHKKIKNKNIRELDINKDKRFIKDNDFNISNVFNDFINVQTHYGIFDSEEIVGIATVLDNGSISCKFADFSTKFYEYLIDLQNYIINKQLEMGYIPFSHINVDDSVSFELYEENGFYVGSEVLEVYRIL